MKKAIIRTIAIVVTIFFLATTIIGIVNYSFLETKINEQIAVYGIFGIFLLSIFVEFIPQFISPHIGVINSALFNIDPLQVTLSTLSGSILGSLLGFEIGRIYGKDFVADLIGNKIFKKTEKGVNEKGKIIVAIAAISPIPYIPMALGAIRMTRRKFILWGILPRSIGIIISVIIFYGIF